MPKKTVTKKKPASADISLDVYNMAGKVVGKETLPKEFFDAAVNETLLAQATRIYQANQRLGTHESQTRGQVTGSTHKIYRQKGTGRARHGSRKAPLFVGGGVAHGPHARDYHLKLSDTMRNVALRSILTMRRQEGQIKIIAGLGKIEPKTKKMLAVLYNLSLLNSSKKNNANVLLLTIGDTRSLLLSGRNIKNLTISPIHMLNAYTVFSHTFVLFMREAIGALGEPQISKIEKTSPKKPLETKKATKKSPAKRLSKPPKKKTTKKAKKTTKSKKA